MKVHVAAALSHENAKGSSDLWRFDMMTMFCLSVERSIG